MAHANSLVDNAVDFHQPRTQLKICYRETVDSEFKVDGIHVISMIG
jgi:hypothetical protein